MTPPESADMVTVLKAVQEVRDAELFSDDFPDREAAKFYMEGRQHALDEVETTLRQIAAAPQAGPMVLATAVIPANTLKVGDTLRLAEPCQPVAWIWDHGDGTRSLNWRKDHDPSSTHVPMSVTPLYPSPPVVGRGEILEELLAIPSCCGGNDTEHCVGRCVRLEKLDAAIRALIGSGRGKTG